MSIVIGIASLEAEKIVASSQVLYMLLSPWKKKISSKIDVEDICPFIYHIVVSEESLSDVLGRVLSY